VAEFYFATRFKLPFCEKMGASRSWDNKGAKKRKKIVNI
jgi:hypothetical protein